MGFLVTAGAITIRCETAAELETAYAVVQKHAAVPHEPPKRLLLSKAVGVAPQAAADGTDFSAYAEFFAGLSEMQTRFIDHLRTHRQVQLHVMCKNLGIEGQALGGVTGGMVRTLQRSHLDPRVVFFKKQMGKGPQAVTYCAGDALGPGPAPRKEAKTGKINS